MFVYSCTIWSASLWESVKIETFVLGLLPISISFTHFNFISVNLICWLIGQITAERMILMILLPDKETHLSHYQMCQGVLNGNLTQWQLRGMIHWVVKTAGWDLCLSLLGFTLSKFTPRTTLASICTGFLLGWRDFRGEVWCKHASERERERTNREQRWGMMLPGCRQWQDLIQTPIAVRFPPWKCFICRVAGRTTWVYRCITALMQEYRNASILSTNIAIRWKLITNFLAETIVLAIKYHVFESKETHILIKDSYFQHTVRRFGQKPLANQRFSKLGSWNPQGDNK